MKKLVLKDLFSTWVELHAGGQRFLHVPDEAFRLSIRGGSAAGHQPGFVDLDAASAFLLRERLDAWLADQETT